MQVGHRHLLIVDPEGARRPHVAAFCHWLVERFQRVPQLAY